MTTWSTSCMDVTAEPGGAMLFLKSCCCPCLVIGDIHRRAGGIGGFACGCISSTCCCPWAPCVMAMSAQVIAQRAGSEESPMKACCLTACCHPCYLSQVSRECIIKQIQPTQFQMEIILIK
ncbi:unnamed protein product [Polarella glacialis]|uniref:Uncharacterized protein n=1 Tax=Polarella glacialis TaxID=89957 RepID=A0A813HX99_POLGL|nr:unnamed protein product [Polarella glacialis]